jgi:hypothetical protein
MGWMSWGRVAFSVSKHSGSHLSNEELQNLFLVIYYQSDPGDEMSGACPTLARDEECV